MAQKKPVGWRHESARHGLAAKGIKTGNKKEMSMADMDKKGLGFWAGKSRTYYLRKYPHPGKFEGGFAIDPLLYEASLEWGDEVIGEVEYGHASTPLSGDQPHETGFSEGIEEIAEREGDHLTQEEKAFLKNIAGALVTEDNFGFVDVEYFEGKKEFDQAIVAIEEEWEKFYREELPEDDGGY
jgi:hypothetical protein